MRPTLLFYSLICLATRISATPIEAPEVHECVFFSCPDPHNTLINRDNAENNIHAAPVSPGKSGYPHVFQNGQGIIDNKKCKGETLLEFPVFADGHLYPFNEKPKADPGPVRAIYTKEHKTLCGVIAHTEPNNSGPFGLCKCK